jgi:hypothetical protein
MGERFVPVSVMRWRGGSRPIHMTWDRKLPNTPLQADRALAPHYVLHSGPCR